MGVNARPVSRQFLKAIFKGKINFVCVCVCVCVWVGGGGGVGGGEAFIEIKCKDKIQGNDKGSSFKIYIHVNHSY